MQNIWTMSSKIVDFIKTDIWRISLKDLPRMKSFLIKQLRTVLVAIRGFDDDKCLLRASSLTFYSLLSIVPVVAMAFGIAKGFGFEKLLEKQLFEKLPGQEEVLVQVVDFARALLENTKGGMIAGAWTYREFLQRDLGDKKIKDRCEKIQRLSFHNAYHPCLCRCLRKYYDIHNNAGYTHNGNGVAFMGVQPIYNVDFKIAAIFSDQHTFHNHLSFNAQYQSELQAWSHSGYDCRCELCCFAVGVYQFPGWNSKI